MLLGILSDTHDNLPKIKKAVAYFNKHKMDFVLHAGDFVAPFTMVFLHKLACPWKGVLGNNDGEKDGLILKSAGKIEPGPLRLRLGRRSIVVVHDLNTINVKKEKADLIVSGHTHQPQIIRQHHRLLVNPGECAGWLSGASTVAEVDLDTMAARIITL